MRLTTLNIVVLPAPFGPMRPQMWPSSMLKLRRSSATMPPKRTVTSFTSSNTTRLVPPPGDWPLTTGRAQRSLSPMTVAHSPWTIPNFSLDEWRSATEPQRVADRLIDMCHGVGFFTITDHGVPDEFIATTSRCSSGSSLCPTRPRR